MATTMPARLLEREIAREQRERSERDEEKAGAHPDDDTRHKDARENSLAGNLPRSRPN